MENVLLIKKLIFHIITQKEVFMEKNQYKKRGILKLLNDSTYILGDHWSEMICATAVALISVLAWLLFPLFGFVVMLFATGFISLGYISFTIDTIKGKSPKVEKVFGNFSQCVNAFCLRIVMCANTILWGFLLIIPGILCAINYSFAMSVMCEDKNITSFAAIEKSKKLVIGHRFEIFDVYLLWFVMILFVFGGLVALFAGIAASTGMNSLVFIFVPAAVVALIAEILILMPFKQICLTSIYLEAKEENKTSKKSPAKKAQLVEEVA